MVADPGGYLCYWNGVFRAFFYIFLFHSLEIILPLPPFSFPAYPFNKRIFKNIFPVHSVLNFCESLIKSERKFPIIHLLMRIIYILFMLQFHLF